MNILVKALTLFLAIAMLVSCKGYTSAPASNSTASTIITKPPAIPTATFTDIPIPLLSPLPSTDTPLLTSEKVAYYYFVNIAKDVPPEGSVVIMPDVYILAPTLSDLQYGPHTVNNLKAALETILYDSRNSWISSNLEIVDVAFDDGHANVVLQGEYFGVGDVTLIAARMQILMTVFANPAVNTASVTLNGDTIGNLGISHSMNAKPADYVFTRAEIETFINENAYVSP